MTAAPRWHRVLVKLSGEAFSGKQESGIDPDMVDFLAKEVQELANTGTQVAAVVGGGNILRGASFATGAIDRATADYMGMLATVLNALALRDSLEKIGVTTRVQTAISMPEVAEPFIRLRAINHLNRGRVVIFAAGTGNPYFTTDTAAALRASEIGAEVLLMAKNKVDGVYDKDPNKFADAVRFDSLGYDEIYSRKLRVLDLTALSLSMENNLPLYVFDIAQAGNMRRAVLGDPVGTFIGRDQ
ncbi:MAG TPA: UMP kinase [Armatimonadota bacterium]